MLQLDSGTSFRRTRPAARTLPVIAHEEFLPTATPAPRLVDGVVAAGPRGPCRTGSESATEAAARQAARTRRRPGLPPEPRCVGRFADGVEVLKDGTELHLASFCLADAELRLAGADDPAFTPLKSQYSDVLGGAPPWHAP